MGTHNKSEREFQAIRTATENVRRPQVLSSKPSRQVDDCWRNADAAGCQHWRLGCSAPTDTVQYNTTEDAILTCGRKPT